MPQPKPSYTIQAPVGDAVPGWLRSRLDQALTNIGVPTDQEWRYVVVPENTWQSLRQEWNPYANDDFGDAATLLHARATYLRQNAIQHMEREKLEALLAHEFGHRYLNSTNEGKVDKLTAQLMSQIDKYGRSDLAAIQAGKQLAQQAQGMVQPARPNIPSALIPGNQIGER